MGGRPGHGAGIVESGRWEVERSGRKDGHGVVIPIESKFGVLGMVLFGWAQMVW